MNRHDLNQYLAGQGPRREPMPAAEFWARFRARASQTPQFAVAPEPLHFRPAAWQFAALAAVLLLVAVLLVRGPFAPGARLGSQMTACNVVAAHSGVIMSSDARRGTLIWITGMGPSFDDGEQ